MRCSRWLFVVTISFQNAQELRGLDSRCYRSVTYPMLPIGTTLVIVLRAGRTRSLDRFSNESHRAPRHQCARRCRRDFCCRSQQPAASPKRPRALPEVTVATAIDRKSPTGMSSPDTSRPSSRSKFGRASPDSSSACRFPKAAFVKQGDVLVTIDPRPYEAEVASADAEARAGADARAAGAAGARAREAAASSTQAISREELDARTSSVAEVGGCGSRRRSGAAQREAQPRLDDGSRADLRPRRSSRDHGGQPRAELDRHRRRC